MPIQLNHPDKIRQRELDLLIVAVSFIAIGAGLNIFGYSDALHAYHVSASAFLTAKYASFGVGLLVSIAALIVAKQARRN